MCASSREAASKLMATSLMATPKLIKVTITVVEAKNLPNMDFWDVSDPYVVVMHDGKKVGQTKVIENNLNPKFNHQFVCDADPSKVFSFLVWDKDTFTSDDSLGSHRMKCRNFAGWVPLKGKGKGEKLSENEAQLNVKIELPPKEEVCCAGCPVM